jgi:hypothetical protein
MTPSGSQRGGAVKLAPNQKRMRKCVAQMQEYVRTYSDQLHYDMYREEVFVDDMLYGIGLALQELRPTDYSGAGGYERLKEYLRGHLK